MGENETRFLSLSGQGFQLIRGTVMAEKKEFIRIRGARENNLKALNVDIPRNQFVVFTGLSGSGKSSLAFDTIYAEGQRRYMESLSSYARQFLGQMEKPNVDSIEGLPPAISIDQKSTNRNPRSTVGTVTEIYDYFRLLYARIGIPHCPKSHQPPVGGPDGRSDHGTPGADENPASRAGCARPQGKTRKGARTGKTQRLCPRDDRRQPV